MKKFKEYDIVDAYPEDGWLKGYFYAHENWDYINGIKKKSNKAYRDLGYIRHKDYILHLLDIRKGDRVLDLGCADGAMMTYCGLLGAEVYGIDISSDPIEKANLNLNKYGIKGQAILGDAKKSNFPEKYFDKIVSSDFLEHLDYEDKILVLREAKRILKPGGVIVIKTPNLTYLRFSKLFKQIIRVLKLKNPFHVVIPHTTGDNLDHVGLITKYEVKKAIQSAGFLNFKFYYDINSKIERLHYFIGELLSEIPFLRDIFTEDLIIVIYKPIILSFFP